MKPLSVTDKQYIADRITSALYGHPVRAYYYTKDRHFREGIDWGGLNNCIRLIMKASDNARPYMS